jgi:hypothetical protein
LREFVTEQVTKLGFAQPEDYIEKLLEEEQKNQLWAYYEKEVGKAIDADHWNPITPEFWDRINQRAKMLQENDQKESVK